MSIFVSILIYGGCIFAGLIAGLILAHSMRKASAPAVFTVLHKHFAPTSLDTLAVTERQFPTRVRSDVQRSLDEFFEAHATITHVCGIRRQDSMMFGMSLSEFLTQETWALSVPLEHEEVDIGEQNPVRCVRNALWLAESEGVNVAILLSQVYGFHDDPKVRIDIATENTPSGNALMRTVFVSLEKAVKEARSYRGKILSFEDSAGYSGEATGITVHKLPAVSRGEVILPEKTLQLLERNVLQFVEQRSRLAELGQSTKKGLLFYGPPGNGKTHTIRYLIRKLKGHTTLLVTAEQVANLTEYMTLARLLRPSIVILEDVDLIARERGSSGGACQESLLNKLLNEMDGLKEDTETLFLLTTNRPEQLENALASRPGRVDQVIEFPYPDAVGRAKLVRLYANAVTVSDEIVDTLVDKTDGVSAAFIKELTRRTIQNHVADGDGQTIELHHAAHALEELLVGGGRLNQRVLGAGEKASVPVG